MTLITVGNSEGSRRCDARCYDAEGGQCDCICGGTNHGAGRIRAVANTREIAERILKEFPDAEIGLAAKQLDLLEGKP